MNKHNLMILQRHLKTVVQDRFDMGVMRESVNAPSVNEPSASYSPQDPEPPCGTICCACGHSVHLFPDIAIKHLSWHDYILEAFGFYATGVEYAWCFSQSWEVFDNTPLGAAKRIYFLAEMVSVPDDFKQPCEKYSEGWDLMKAMKEHTKARLPYKQLGHAMKDFKPTVSVQEILGKVLACDLTFQNIFNHS